MSDSTHAVEAWKPVSGYEGRYRVSDQGRVFSERAGRILRPTQGRYLYVSLSQNGRAVKRYVHDLVADAFLGPRPPGQEVRHIKDDRSDNRAIALAYGTHSANMLDSVANGTHFTGSKTHCVNAHELTEANTYIGMYTARDGTRRRRRQCRRCSADQQRAYKLRKAS